MHSSRSHAIHIRTPIDLPPRRKGTISDTLGVKPKPIFLRVVLSRGKGAGDDFTSMAISEAREVLIRIVCTGRFATLKVSVVEN